MTDEEVFYRRDDFGEIADHYVLVPLDKVSETPPKDPLLGRYHPSEHTIIYADGGVGKGVLSARDHVILLRDDPELRLLIVDYEEHATSEWKPRMRQFAATLAPNDPDLMKRALVFQVRPDFAIWDATPLLRRIIEDEGITRLLVDSALYACGNEEAEKSMAAKMYSHAIAELGRPVTTLAHVTKLQPKALHPYGSVFWSNGARITNRITAASEEVGSTRTVVMVKGNQGGKTPAQEIDWSWEASLGTGVMPPDLTFGKPTNQTTVRDGAAGVLIHGPLPVGDLLAEVNILRVANGQKPTTKATLSKELSEAKTLFESVDGTWRSKLAPTRSTRSERGNEGVPE